MRRTTLVASLLILVLAMTSAVAVVAQESPPSTLSWIQYVKADRGMHSEFEAAMKRHAAWHAENAPDQGYLVGQVVTGDRAGQYIIIVGGLQWSDMDGLNADIEQADSQNWDATGGKLSTQTASMITRSLPAVSNPGDGAVGAVQLTSFRVKQGMGGQFMEAVGKFHEGTQQGPDRYSWSAGVAGAGAPSFTRARLEANWAGFAPDDSFSLADVMGEEEVAATWQQFIECVESRESNFIVPRPDLAYAGAE